MISVIIPALNEEIALPATLDHVLSQAGDFEVIVVDGGSADRTCNIVRARPRVALLTAPKGRASQMNAGARAASGEWLLFLHADTQLPAGVLGRLNALESDFAVQAGGFRHRFSGDDWRLRFISWINNLRCRYSRIFYGDQALFVRRALFERLGGFPDQPILEDVAFGEMLLQVTMPLLLDGHVITDSRKFVQMGVWRSLAHCARIIIRVQMGLPVAAADGFFKDVR